MPNRSQRRHPVPPDVAPARITVSSGEWYVMGAMTGRDYLFLRSLKGREATDDDVVLLLGLLEKRITSSSVADPMDRPMEEIMEIVTAWFTGQENSALPPYARDDLKRALGLAAVSPDARASVPLSYALDQLDRRYSQPPGAHRDWPVEDLIRALEFMRLESSVKVKRG